MNTILFDSTIAESIQINGKHVYIVYCCFTCQNIGIGSADLRAKQHKYGEIDCFKKLTWKSVQKFECIRCKTFSSFLAIETPVIGL